MKAALVLFKNVYNTCNTHNNRSRDASMFNLFTFYLYKNTKTKQIRILTSLDL